MVSNKEKWIRIFDIPDVSKHKNGFTVYKVISMLYPESCPDAITKITVWKRFNDFKKLHKEMRILYNKQNCKEKFPALPRNAIFKRFDENTIQERKQGILNFLEFVGANSQLFTSNEFVKFFETSLTPVEQATTNISAIRADLRLPDEPEFYSNEVNSDDERTVSDTDSIATLNSLSPSVQTSEEPYQKRLHSKFNSSTSIVSKTSDTLSASELSLLDGYVFLTPPDTPGASGTDNIQYIIDASVHVNLAVELESDKNYEGAYSAYKTAIDILLKNGKDDMNYERKQMVRYKTEKYLIRTEKLYNMYLSPEIKDVQLLGGSVEPQTIRRPLFDLYKFKVINIIASGMVVLHSETQQLFYVKVLHKTIQFLNDNLILPENVPYMVKLHNHYNCENALFLVLEYNSGITLEEYLLCRSKESDEIFRKNNDQILQQMNDLSDNDSEHSFSDLINDYTNNKKINSHSEVISMDVANQKDSKESLQHEPQSQLDNGKASKVNSNRDSIDLDDQENMNIVAPEKDVIKWASQIVVALEKLHALGVVCRDLQMKNILINENGNITLTYMCNAKEICDFFTSGININLAPELYGFQKITQAVDWWSFGAVLYELLVGMPLSVVHANGITSYTHIKIPKYVSPEGKSILKQLLTYEPDDRLGSGLNGTENLKSHPFFSTVSWDSLMSSQ